ncbi:hypothetical protein GALMADRAFT_236505 [Galerina marginata CBS 339.88]|uniref:DH domain-containing protein n=1 Tax=Galerina marginata (strain CBS 339.88) TaxID=685588 RepID=A0A067TY72_GALM3|nr:hypothetical protein GALMADRAFT_236505 [Galerina marginata CBS 339.88]
MQVVSTSFLIDPPLSSPTTSGPSYCGSKSPPFFRRPPEVLEQPSLMPPRVRSDSTDSAPITTLLKSTTVSPSPKRLNVCGFSPLPPIVASPIFTPHSSLPSQSLTDAFLSSLCTKGDFNSGSNSSSCVSSRVLFSSSTPTWIATPPTPPSKSVRRSNTLSGRRSTFKVLNPSASFPASMHPRANREIKGLKRSFSVPTFYPSTEAPSFDLTNFMGEGLVHSPKAISCLTIENPFDATFSILDGIVGPESARRKDRSGSHSKSTFRLSNSILASGDEDLTVGDKTGDFSPEEPSPDGSWSDHSIEDIWEVEKNKDGFRKYHALKELLATEAGYLMDLKALVTVYLRNLPTLAARTLNTSSTFGRASASFTGGPWVHSYTQLQAAALSSSSTLPETQHLPVASPASNSVKEPVTKTNSRYIFSDIELDSLTRNGEELLQLHEHFVRELRAILEPLGISMEHDKDDHGHDHLEKLDAAIRAVSTKFATEASRFNAYQAFCAGHPEAVDIVRKAYQQFPLELDAFEHRCATMVSDMLEAGLKPAASEPNPTSFCASDSPTSQFQNLAIDDRKRAMSSSSLDGAVRTIRRRPSILMAKDSVVFPSEPKREKCTPRIAFTDYMIKPIQRICKYPLLLDQLLPSKALRMLSQNADTRSDVDVVVESAAQAMRHVATSVDEARHRQDIAIQSALVFSRICLESPSPSASPSGQALTPEFFASLGNCILSGSLDGMHYHPNRPLGQTSSVKAKYFGAFLYSGGYLILVKVSKGRKYEPKHWFSLVDFEVIDDGSWLPYSFRLSLGEQHFELAAACQREKETWLSSIQESLKHGHSWVNEPTPSFKFDEKGELLPESEDGHSESPTQPLVGLATIRSIPEVGHASDTEVSEPLFGSLRGHTKSRKSRAGYEAPFNPRQEMPPPSRRSSSNSVKAIFSPMSAEPETLLIRRSSPAARLHIEQELQDVISQSILTARSYAFSHEVELFQAPRTTKSGFSRSNSGIGKVGMARLSKHESVRVPRRRTTESLDGLLKRGSSRRTTSVASRRPNIKKLSLASIDCGGTDAVQESGISSYSSPPSSQPSSSRVASLRASETHQSSTLPTPPPSAVPETSSMKTRSFVRNVKGIFQLRPASPVSPVSVIVSHPSQPSGPLTASPVHHINPYNMLHRWTKDSLRRRARSVPDEPNNIITTFDDPEKPYPSSPSRKNTPLST